MNEAYRNHDLLWKIGSSEPTETERHFQEQFPL
jgi:hypothetical protein